MSGITIALILAAFAVYQMLQAQSQAGIALARQLAAQAQSLYATQNSKQVTAVLLAIKSIKTSLSFEAGQILQINTLGHPIAHITPRYEGPVFFVAFSSDGKHIALGTDIGLTIREVTTSQDIAYMGADGYITSVAFSPDSKYVALGSISTTLAVWEVATGEEIARMTHEDQVTSVAFSPDGKYVASGSWDGTARVWEATTGKEISHMTHENKVTLVAFSPDGKYVASGSEDNTARVWEVTTGEEIARMTHD